MVEPTTIESLKRLTRGKYKLTPTQMGMLIRDVQRNPSHELLSLVFPPKPAKRPAPEKPEWLKDMEAAKKQIAWAESSSAVEKLYEIVEHAGFDVPSSRRKTFPAAAKQLASDVGSEKVRDAYVRWIERYVSTNRPL